MTFPNAGARGRSRPYLTRIGTEVTASRPAGKRRGGESELKRPNTTLRKLPAGTRPVPENEPDQLAPEASERGNGGSKASATSGGVVRPDASRCDARSSRPVGATKSPNFVPPDTWGLPIERPRQAPRGLLTPLRVDRDVARPSCDSLKPLGDCRVTLEVEAALVGDMRVRIQRDVCDRERARGKKGVLFEVPLHCV